MASADRSSRSGDHAPGSRDGPPLERRTKRRPHSPGHGGEVPIVGTRDMERRRAVALAKVPAEPPGSRGDRWHVVDGHPAIPAGGAVESPVVEDDNADGTATGQDRQAD